MLVLSRRAGQRIRVGEDIVITVVEVEGGRVRVGIDAPRSVVVHREEIYMVLAEANTSASEQTVPTARSGRSR